MKLSGKDGRGLLGRISSCSFWRKFVKRLPASGECALVHVTLNTGNKERCALVDENYAPETPVRMTWAVASVRALFAIALSNAEYLLVRTKDPTQAEWPTASQSRICDREELSMLRSVLIFSLFSILGPLVQRLSFSAFISAHRNDLAFMFWPALALSAGGRAGDARDFWVSVIANVFLFAALGFLTGLASKRVKAVIAIYLCVCALIAVIEAWGSGFSLAYFSWTIFLVVCIVYWLPFWSVLALVSRRTGASAVPAS